MVMAQFLWLLLLTCITVGVSAYFGAQLTKNKNDQPGRGSGAVGAEHQSRDFWSDWGLMLMIVSAVIGALIASLILAAANSDTGWWIFNRGTMIAFAPWIGDFLQSFAPWGVIFVLLLLFPASRKAIARIIQAPGDLISGIGRNVADGGTLSFQGLTLDRRLSRIRNVDYEEWIEALESQVKRYKENFDESTKDSIKRVELEPSIKNFCDEFLFKKITSSGKNEVFDDDKNTIHIRFTIHLQDLHFDDMLYQLTEYYYEKGHWSSRSRARRFSIRHGIVGMAYRVRHTYFDEHVSTDAGALVDRWGFTQKEGSHRGKARQTHLAHPVFLDGDENPKFIIFCDAGPESAFGDKLKKFKEDKDKKDEMKKFGAEIDRALEKYELKEKLSRLWNEHANERKIFPINRVSSEKR